MWRLLLLLGVILLHSPSGMAQPAVPKQVVRGRVSDSLGVPLPGASVFVSRVSKPGGLAYTITNGEGYYLLTWAATTDTLQLNVRLLGYQPHKQLMAPDHSEQAISVRLNPGATTLNEVVVRQRRDRPAFNDTTTISAKQYIDGAEMSLEDVLKKIPGFRVKDDGKISYKGTEIAAIHVDGENLTGENYSRISRNLRPSLIENIQTIERFVENALLGGLTASQETVLNITLPPDRRNALFGDVSGSYGVGHYRKAMGNVFSYHKRVKAYLLGAHNNIGERHNADVSEVEGLPANSRIRPSVPSGLTSPALFRPDLANLNQETNLSLSTVYKPSDKLRLLSDVTVYDNRAEQLLRQTSRFLGGDDDSVLVIGQTEQVRQQRRAIQVRTQLNLTLSTKSNMQYDFRVGALRTGRTNHLDLTTQWPGFSLAETVTQQLVGQPRYLRQGVTLTTRLNTRSALQLVVSQSINDLPQALTIQANADRLGELMPQLKGTSLVQQTRPYQIGHTAQTEYFRSSRWLTYSLQAGLKQTNARLSNALASADEAQSQTLQQTHFWGMLKTSKTIGPFLITANVGLNHLQINTADSTSARQSFAYPDLRLSGRYSLSSNSELRIGYTLDRTFSQLNDLFTKPVLADYRSIFVGTPQVLNQREQALTLYYNYADNTQTTTLEAGLSYTHRNVDFLQTIRLNQWSSTTTMLIGPPIYSTQAMLQVSRFLSPVSLRVGFEGSVQQTEVYNQINESGLRQNRITVYRQSVKLGTGFVGLVNFYAGATLLINQFMTQTSDPVAVSGSNSWVQTYLQARYQRKKVLISSKMDHLRLNSRDFVLLDANAQYTPVASRFVFMLTLRNLTNRQTVEQWTLTDRLSTSSSYRLLPRLVLVGASLKF